MIEKKIISPYKVVGLQFSIAFLCLLNACNQERETKNHAEISQSFVALPQAGTATSAPTSTIALTSTNAPGATPFLTPRPTSNEYSHICNCNSNIYYRENDGLIGIHVAVLVIDPFISTALYAGTSNDIFKSTDGGETWSAESTGLTVTR